MSIVPSTGSPGEYKLLFEKLDDAVLALNQFATCATSKCSFTSVRDQKAAAEFRMTRLAEFAASHFIKAHSWGVDQLRSNLCKLDCDSDEGARIIDTIVSGLLGLRKTLNGKLIKKQLVEEVRLLNEKVCRLEQRVADLEEKNCERRVMVGSGSH